MKKVFLSHSSVQKPFIRQVAKELGQNLAIVDEYTFEESQDLWEEIRKNIDKSDIFVYFISREAISAPWVQAEIGYVMGKVMNEDIVFIPFIIDDSHHSEVDKWIQKRLLKPMKSPKIVARIIRREVSKLLAKEHYIENPHGLLFEGRDEDIRILRHSINHYNSADLRAIFISGQKASGRQRLLNEVINRHIRREGFLSYNPITVRLDEDSSLTDLIGILNDYTRTIDNEELFDCFADRDSTQRAAVDVFNALGDMHEYVVVEEAGAIVRSNGRIVDWFEALLSDEALTPRIHFFIASKYALGQNYNQSRQVVARRISLLDGASIRSLLGGYLKICDLEMEVSIREDVATLSKGYPDVVYTAVDRLKESNIVELKKFLTTFEGLHLKDIGAQIEALKECPTDRELMILLSKFEFISFPTVVDLFGETEAIVLESLERLILAGIIEAFGRERNYLRLAPPVRDYLTRFKFDLTGKYKNRLRRKMIDYVNDFSDAGMVNDDFGILLLTAKEAIRQKGVKQLPKRYLIPAFILKVIIEEYNAHKYDQVIELARYAIYGYEGKKGAEADMYTSMRNSMRYWYCLALARKNNNEALREAERLNPYGKYFVRGFYYMCLPEPEYREAAREYDLALREAPNAIKAKHQLVVCLQKLGDHERALSLARDCYEDDPTNPYYLQAYFESLVKSGHTDICLMKDLITEMKALTDRMSNALAVGMEAQYDYFIFRQFETAYAKLCKFVALEPDSDGTEIVLRIAKEITSAAREHRKYLELEVLRKSKSFTR